MSFSEHPFSELLSVVVDNRGRTCPTSESGIPLIATNCIRNEFLYPTYDKVRFVSDETYRHWFRGHPIPGDIIFVNKATPGRVCLVPDPVDFCIAQDMVAVRANPSRVYPNYLFAVLRSPTVQEKIGQMHVGTLIPHFKKGDFNKLLLPVPDHRAQVFIGDAYFELSAKIDANRRMNATLEAMARALFQSWFVDFDPVRAKLDGRQPAGVDSATSALFPEHFEMSSHGAIPRGWTAACLGDVGTNPRRSVRPDDVASDTPYIALEHMPRRSIALGDWDVAEGAVSGKSAFRKGEILFGKLRPYFHKVGVAPFDGICSTDILVLAPTSPEWFGFLLGHASSDELIQFTDGASTGTKMPRTNWSDISSFKITLPPKPIALAYTRAVEPMISCIQANLAQSRTLATLRDTLLPKLLSGEIRVSEAERFVISSS